MDSFSEQLRATRRNPSGGRFSPIRSCGKLKDGTLPLETFQNYLGQDYLYLEGFARCVAIALAKAPERRSA